MIIENPFRKRPFSEKKPSCEFCKGPKSLKELTLLLIGTTSPGTPIEHSETYYICRKCLTEGTKNDR